MALVKYFPSLFSPRNQLVDEFFRFIEEYVFPEKEWLNELSMADVQSEFLGFKSYDDFLDYQYEQLQEAPDETLMMYKMLIGAQQGANVLQRSSEHTYITSMKGFVFTQNGLVWITKRPPPPSSSSHSRNYHSISANNHQNDNNNYNTHNTHRRHTMIAANQHDQNDDSHVGNDRQRSKSNSRRQSNGYKTTNKMAHKRRVSDDYPSDQEIDPETSSQFTDYPDVETQSVESSYDE